MNLADLIERDPTPDELIALSTANDATKADLTAEIRVLADRLKAVAVALGYPAPDSTAVATKTAAVRRTVFDN